MMKSRREVAEVSWAGARWSFNGREDREAGGHVPQTNAALQDVVLCRVNRPGGFGE
jgi:hypothetical protein